MGRMLDCFNNLHLSNQAPYQIIIVTAMMITDAHYYSELALAVSTFEEDLSSVSAVQCVASPIAR